MDFTIYKMYIMLLLGIGLLFQVYLIRDFFLKCMKKLLRDICLKH